MRRTLIPLTLAAALVPAAALAQDEPAAEPWDAGPPPAAEGGSWAFAAGAATDNRSKGASKTGGDPYVWGLAEWSDAAGVFYASGEAETIDHSTGADVELELAVGARPQVAGFDLDLSVAHKWLLNAAPGADDDEWQFTASASRSLGPASARLQLQHSPDGAGATRDWTWVEGRLGWDFSPRLSGSAAVGRREQENSVDYTAWNAGVTYAVSRNLELDLRWYDTSERDLSVQYDSALVAAVNVYF